MLDKPTNKKKRSGSLPIFEENGGDPRDTNSKRCHSAIGVDITLEKEMSARHTISLSEPNLSNQEQLPIIKKSLERTMSDQAGERNIFLSPFRLGFKPSDQTIDEEQRFDGPYAISSSQTQTEADAEVEFYNSKYSDENCYLAKELRKNSEPNRILGRSSSTAILVNMKRYSMQINSTMNSKLSSMANKLSIGPKRCFKGDIQRSYETWVEKNIQVRECQKFVKKSDDTDNDPICYCRNKQSKHMAGTFEMGPNEKWEQDFNTIKINNNAFGQMKFKSLDQEEVMGDAQYIRIAKDYSESPLIETLKPLFKEFWKLREPDLLISVSGGAKSFNVSQDICASFQQGLLNAAKSTNAWIITGGQNCGVMKLVGDVIGNSISNERIPTIGVGNWGKTYRNEKLLRNNKASRDAVYYTLDNPKKGFATLDPNHTHHFLVDDGTIGNDGIEYGFRASLETLICDLFRVENVPLPMVCIMVEGGMRSLEIAISTLKKGNTLIVLKGSGRASDILCYGFENSIEIEQELGSEGKSKRTLPIDNGREIKRLIDKDFSKYNIEEQMLELVLEISTYRDFVTVFSIHNPEPLDFYILSSLMKSSANANALAAAKMRQMRLAITWGHAKIAREFIFSQKLYKFSVGELNDLMLFSIIKQRTDFVKLLMDYGCDLKQFLTAQNLKKLYNSLNNKSGGYRLLMEKAERKQRKAKREFRRSPEEGGVGRPDKVEIQLSDVGSLLGRIMQGSYTSLFNKKHHDPQTTFDNPFDLMTIYCALDNCQAMALLFWEKCRTPMATGIIAHRVYNYLDMMEAKWARMDEEMTEQLENAASQFEMLSCSLMTACYHNYEKKEWVDILEVKMADWGNLTLFEVAQITNAKTFLSHAAYQSYLTDIWMGEIHPSTPFYYLVLAAVLPPLPMFLQYNSIRDGPEKSTDSELIKGRQPNPLMRFKLFYTSPAIKFILNSIFYLVFLGLYICQLLSPNVCLQHPAPDRMITWMDYYLIIFVSSTIPIEISQVIDGNTKSLMKKFKIYFKQLYNVIDLFAILIFMFAFILKVQIKCNEDERYMLWKFSSYHYYRLFASFCFILYSVRFIQMFEMNAKIGPKIFMLKRMAVDLFFFLFLLGVFTFSYCVASEALLYPFHNRPVNKTIFAAFRRSYFNVFGDLNIDGLTSKLTSGHCNNYTWSKMVERENRTFDVNDFAVNGCDADDDIYINAIMDTTVGLTNYYITFFLLCSYVLIVNIMLINLLIAIFSNTYADSKAKSGIIYKTQRASVIVEFEERPFLPNPLSLLYFFFRVPYKLCKRCCASKNRNGSIRNDNRKTHDHSILSKARKAELIEAECMVLLLRKKQMDSQNDLQIIQMQNKKIVAAVERIHAELKSITIKQQKESLLNLSLSNFSLRKTNIFEKTASKVVQANKRQIPRHKYSLQKDAYSKYDVIRVQVPKEAIEWEIQLDFYDPPEFTDYSIKVEPNEPDLPDEILFNENREHQPNGINRTSFTNKQYHMDGDDPLNCCGRTGLKGRGIFPRWGPNHYAVTIITRWYLPGTGNKVYIKNRPVIEVLLFKYDTTKSPESPSYYQLPSVRIDREDPDRQHNKRSVQLLCYNNTKDTTLISFKDNFNKDNKPTFSFSKIRTTSVKSESDTLFNDAFKHAKPVYRGYFDDPFNTDNAWKEIDAIHVHFEKSLANKPLQKGPYITELSWHKLDGKVNMPNNEAWLLKRVCYLQKAYNPYSGECLMLDQ